MRIPVNSWSFIIQFLLVFITRTKVVGQCRRDQQSSLIRLKNELVEFTFSTSSKLSSWNQTRDCCQWGGVGCDVNGNGRVIDLDLSGELISGGINQTSSLFSLQFLQRLNLGNNRFNSSPIPSGIGNLTELRYLNLTSCGLTGQIPFELSRLTQLVVLDLSSLYFTGAKSLYMENPNFMMLVMNMTALKELYLDGVNISANGNDLGQSISTFLPNLEVLSMSNSYLTGPIDPSLGKLEFLSVIRLDQNNLSAPVPDFFADFRNLTVLHLSYCNLNGTFPERIFQLPTLQTLDLKFNQKLHGLLPEFPDNSSLQNLELSYTNFSGPLPNSIGRLMNLSRIEFSNCNFSGNIPTSMQYLTKLVYLDLSWNSFSGPIPSFQLCKNLTYVDLSRNSFSGSVPSLYFEGLQKLVNIDLRNNLFNGAVPSSLFSIPSLQKIQLSNNQFDDQIAEFLSPASTSLDTLDLSNNNVQGPIPRSFFQIQSLNILALSYNNFSGPLKLEEISNSFPNLTKLELSCNNLSIDANFSNDGFLLLTVLKLASSKLKQFPDLRYQSRISILDLSDNEIGGEIPNWIWNFRSLLHLNLSFNSFVGMQKPFAIPISLTVLDLHFNQLGGEIPIVPPSIFYLDYSSNNLGSSLPDEIGNNLTTASFFSLAKNRLSGVIPESICKVPFLQVLDLSSNEFNGSIPSCLIEKTSWALGVLNLGNNNLSGSINGNFPTKCALKTLDVNGNLLEGKIPISLANCKDLEVLNLGNNKMSDNYPCFLENSSNLRVLVLRSNKFYGDINCRNDKRYYGNKLQIIDLALNQFSGTLPPQFFLNWKGMMMVDVENGKAALDHLRFEFMKLSGFYYQDTVTVTNKGSQMELVKILTVFTSIDLSGNQLEGEIPFSIGSLKWLYVLNLSHNALTGPIPSSIGNLTQLGSLDLSINKLTGTIPLQLLDLTFLSVLNLSYNKLTGMIPRGKQFSTFTETSFLGNPELCGPIINVSCNPEAPSSSPLGPEKNGIFHQTLGMYISMIMGFFVGLSGVVWPLVFNRRWRMTYFSYTDEIILRILPCKDRGRNNHNRRRVWSWV